MKRQAFFLTLSLLVTLSLPQENYSTWAYHKNLILNTSGSGANVMSDVYNFPVLVRLGVSDAAIFTQAVGNGKDIRFTKRDNVTRLPHQLELWDVANKSAAIWVLVDTIHGNVSNQSIRVHWGQGAAQDSSNGAAVFDTGRGFQAVWHMDGNAPASDEPDATKNGFTAAQNSNPASVSGMIAGARNFDGSFNYFSTTNTASGPLNFPQNGRYTISAWVNAVAFTAHGVVVSKHDRQYALKLNNGNSWEFFEFEDASGWNAVSYPPADAQGTWEYLTGVWDGFNAYLYINGIQVGNSPNLTSSTNARVTNTNVTIGRQNESANRYFMGLMDEVRMASVSRDSNWVRLEFQNQQANQTLASLSDTIPTGIGRPPLLTASEPRLSIDLQSGSLIVRMQKSDALKVRLLMMDAQGRTIWNQTVGMSPGMNRITWNRQLGNERVTGICLLQATFLDAKKRTISIVERKIPFIR